MVNELKAVQIEVTNLCNSKCVFCSHSKLKKFGIMSDELFKKIILDLKEIPSIEVVVPMLLGEPFCDRKIIQKLKLINKILPDKKVVIFTNTSLLTKKKVEELSKIKNLRVFFSLNGARKETRKRLMGLDDYDHAVKMINLYAKTGNQFEVTFVNYPGVSEAELFEFKKKYAKTMIIKYKNFSGDNFEAGPQSNCARAIKEMTIMWDGRVNLCCMDAFGKVIFGDVNKQSVKEVWESSERQRYSEAHKNGEYMGGICSNCTRA